MTSSSEKPAGSLRTTVFLIVLCLAALVSVCNISFFWAKVPFRWFAGISLLILVGFVPRHIWRVKLGLFTLFAAWLCVMPMLPWTRETQFFLKGGLIYRGMAEGRAKRLMKEYYVQGDDRHLRIAPQSPSADWVFVNFQDRRVSSVEMSPD